jgi:hypothetical protein
MGTQHAQDVGSLLAVWAGPRPLSVTDRAAWSAPLDGALHLRRCVGQPKQGVNAPSGPFIRDGEPTPGSDGQQTSFVTVLGATVDAQAHFNQ